jgi:hypothetical protein
MNNRFVYTPAMPTWTGWVYAVLFVLLPFLAVILESHGHYRAFVLGWRLRSIAALMIYNKSMSLSAAARQVCTDEK